MCQMCNAVPVRGLISGDAEVESEVLVGPSARVEGRATIKGGDIRIRGRALVRDSRVYGGDILLYDDSVIEGGSYVSGTVRMSDNARICDTSWIVGADVTLMNNALIECAVLKGNIVVAGDSVIRNVRIEGGVFREHAEVTESEHFLLFHYREGWVTLHRTKGGGHLVNAGCQSFTLGNSRKWYEGLAEEHDWELPEYWSHMMKVMEAQAETWK